MVIYQYITVHSITFCTFRDMLWTSFLFQKFEREVTLYILVTGLWFLHCTIRSLHCTILFMTLYQCIKFHIIPLYTLRDMLRTSFLLQKLTRMVVHGQLVEPAVCLCDLYDVFLLYIVRDTRQNLLTMIYRSQ